MSFEDRNHDSGAAPELESAVINALARPYEGEKISAPVCIAFHSIRRRLADLDNLSGKAVLDGIIENGILPDDSPEFVKEITHTQEKTDSVEKTIITLETV